MQDFRASTLPSTEKALAFTRDKAFVWSYTSASPSPPTTIINLPSPSRPREPLPLGSLVRLTSDGDTGLLVIAPTTGKITYWDNIENASALSLFEKRRHGLEGSMGSLLSGETAVNLENAGQAGLVVIFSTGRTARLLLQDAQSRPAVIVNWLRSAQSNDGGGIFVSLRSVFSSGGWLTDVVGARSRAAKSRGVMDVVVATQHCTFQFWQLGWSGQPVFEGQLDARNYLEETLVQTYPNAAELFSQGRDIRIVDFALLGGAASPLDGPTSSREDNSFDIMALVAMKDSQLSDFGLIQMTVNLGGVEVGRILPLQLLSTSLLQYSRWQPRICVPSQSETAYVVFEKAVAVISLATAKKAGEASLLKESSKLPAPFQDVITFRLDDEIHPVGLAPETPPDSRRQSSVLVFLRYPGTIRITASEPEGKTAVVRNKITAKSKIEQAISFGAQAANPLDLTLRFDAPFPTEEVEESALHISEDVLSSDFPFLDCLTSSMDKELEQRERLLRNLAQHVIPAYPSLSRKSRWELRFDAEKIAAARRIWSLYQKALEAEYPGQRHLLPSVVYYMPDNNKNIEIPPAQADRLRWWFAKDLSRMGYLLIYISPACKHLSKQNSVSSYESCTLVSEGGDMLIAGLSTAYTFRSEAAGLYSLEGEYTKDGVLQNGHDDMPEPWTSALPLPERCHDFLLRALEVAEDCFTGDSEREKPVGAKIANDIPDIIREWSRMFVESCLWLNAHEQREYRDWGRDAKPQWEGKRRQILSKLANIDQTSQGMALAEQYEDMRSLVVLIQEESTYFLTVKDTINDRIVESEADRKKIEQDLQSLEEAMQKLESRIKGYVRKFGLRFTEVWYGVYVVRKDFAGLLDQSNAKEGYRDEVTEFLRAHPYREKLSWVNDVLAERDYAHAGDTLSSAASTETSLWDKKIELSCSKLALLAADEAANSSSPTERRKPVGTTHTARNYDAAKEAAHESALTLVNVQDALYKHLEPALYATTDAIAQLQVAMQDYGRVNTADRSALHQLLERGFEALIARHTMDVEQLVDVLTLMDHRRCDATENDIAGRAFFLALTVLRAAGDGVAGGEARRDTLRRTAWRRAYIQDRWDRLNDTRRRSDERIRQNLEDTVLFDTFYHCLRTGMCLSTVLVLLFGFPNSSLR